MSDEAKEGTESLLPALDREWSFLYANGSRVFVSSESQARKIAALSTGEVQWRTPWRDAKGERLATPSDYCQAFYDWRDALRENGVMPDVVAALDSLYLPIVKSNYLARRIYGGDEHRTEKCPTHQGRWSGCLPAPCPDGCSSGSNVTGWLPSPHSFDPWPDDDESRRTAKHWDWDSTTRCSVCGGTAAALVHQEVST